MCVLIGTSMPIDGCCHKYYAESAQQSSVQWKGGATGGEWERLVQQTLRMPLMGCVPADIAAAAVPLLLSTWLPALLATSARKSSADGL